MAMVNGPPLVYHGVNIEVVIQLNMHFRYCCLLHHSHTHVIDIQFVYNMANKTVFRW